MRFFIAALSILFAASLIGYLVVRGRSESWIPEGVQAAPPGLWISTIIIVLSGITIQLALTGIRRGRALDLKLGLAATFLLGLAFLVAQALNWLGLIRLALSPEVAAMYQFTFFFLTGLHGLHVLGGLIPLGMALSGALHGAYSAENHAGVHHVAIYWHFLGVVWLVMFVVMFLV